MMPLSISRIRNNMNICKLLVRDETGTASITWFNQPYLKGKFKVGETYRFYGKVKHKLGNPEFNSPVFDDTTSKNTGKIIPLYPLTSRLSQNVIRQIIENGLNETKGNIAETLPEYLLEEYKLENLVTAINEIHFPKNFESYSRARKRLVFEELLGMQLALLNLKSKYQADMKGISFSKNVKISDMTNNLPFKLTGAQTRVLEEIESDMEKEKTMNRLLQGDVGSGKTIVSIMAAYKAVKSRTSGSGNGTNSNFGRATFGQF